jgi:hypothetical protein
MLLGAVSAAVSYAWLMAMFFVALAVWGSDWMN